MLPSQHYGYSDSESEEADDVDDDVIPPHVDSRRFVDYPPPASQRPVTSSVPGDLFESWPFNVHYVNKRDKYRMTSRGCPDGQNGHQPSAKSAHRPLHKAPVFYNGSQPYDGKSSRAIRGHDLDRRRRKLQHQVSL